MHRIRNYSVLFAVCAVVVAFWMGGSYAAEKEVQVYTTGEYKTDMARMVEAYEKLSTQYLSVVQQNLAQMNQADQQVLKKLVEIEKKIDVLTEKVNALRPEGPRPPQPVTPTTN